MTCSKWLKAGTFLKLILELVRIKMYAYVVLRFEDMWVNNTFQLLNTSLDSSVVCVPFMTGKLILREQSTLWGQELLDKLLFKCQFFFQVYYL